MGAGANRRARRTSLRVLMTLGGATCATALVACSVLLDWSGFSNGPGPDGGHPMTGPDDATLDGDAGTDGPDDANILAADGPALVSCAGGGLCSPPVPANAPGWSGPYSLSVGAPGALLPCSTPSYEAQPVFEGDYGLKADPPQCGCSCSAPHGQGCGPPQVTFYTDSTCNTVCGEGQVNGCLVIPSCPGSGGSGPANFLEIGNTTPSATASCTPDGSVAMPAASWSGAARVCQLAPGAIHDRCGSGEYCLPASTPYCIMFAGDAGDAPCPAGEWYKYRHVFYTGMDDQRGCTSCTCGAVTGASCAFLSGSPDGGMVASPLAVGSFDTSCNLPLGMPFFVPAPCTARVPSTFGLRTLLDAAVVEAGACSPSAVAPLEAGAVPIGATTVCCTQ
ncbi:MAG: hypothetical protein ACRENE_01710 [Polyangiaceae bacterium]